MASKDMKMKKNKQMINGTLLVLLVTMIVVMCMSLFNIYKVRTAVDGSSHTVDRDQISNKYINDYYSIGNNATDINKEYFLDLNQAIEAKDNKKIAEDIVKCFVTEYYTWSNKDGNYDVGGTQYIYTDRKADFVSYSRDNFYSNMDEYLMNNTHSTLMEVSKVSIDSTSEGQFSVMNAAGESVNYPSYDVTASWEYKASSSVDTNVLQKHAVFHVIDHDGRMEIAGIE